MDLSASVRLSSPSHAGAKGCIVYRSTHKIGPQAGSILLAAPIDRLGLTAL